MQLIALLALGGLASAINTRGSRANALERKGVNVAKLNERLVSAGSKKPAPLVKRKEPIIKQTEKTQSTPKTLR